VVDDYGGYKALFAAARAHPEQQQLIEPCVELACWAHARRKFFDLFQASQSPVAQEALQRIALLYAIEAEARDLTVDERQRLRNEKKPASTFGLARLVTANPPAHRTQYCHYQSHRLQLETLAGAHPLRRNRRFAPRQQPR